MRKLKDQLVIELRDLMKEKGLSQATMGRLIGCNPSQIGRWIKGEAKPTPVYRDLIKKGLNRAKSL